MSKSIGKLLGVAQQYKEEEENYKKSLSYSKLTPYPFITQTTKPYIDDLQPEKTSAVSQQKPLTAAQRDWSTGNETVDRAGCIADGGYQGYTLGWGDEMIGAGYATGKALDDVSELKNPFPSVSQNYQTARDMNRNHLNWCNDNYPISTSSAEFVGNVVSPINVVKAARRAPNKVKAAQMGKNAVGNSMVYGHGSSEGNIGEQAMGTVVGGVTGKIGNSATRKINREFLQTPPTQRSRELLFNILQNSFSAGSEWLWDNGTKNIKDKF